MPSEVVTPAAPAVEVASVELELGVPLPEEVNSLYGATGSVGCYINFLAPVWRLVELNKEAKLDIAEVYADFGNRIWGPELNRPGIRGGSRPLKEDESYEYRDEVQVVAAAVLAGGAGAGGASGDGAA